MERYESEPQFRRTSSQQVRVSYLTEYIRKIHQEQGHKFRCHEEDNAEYLYIPALRRGEDEVELCIRSRLEGNIRGSDFTLELLSEKAPGERYVLRNAKPWTILKQVWNSDHYETVSRQDTVGQEEVAYDVERILLNTMVEQPVTSLQEEQEFWQIAVASSVEEFQAQGIEIIQYFNQVEGESVQGRMELGFLAIWSAAHPPDQRGNESWMAGAITEDVARYCRRQMRNRLS